MWWLVPLSRGVPGSALTGDEKLPARRRVIECSTVLPCSATVCRVLGRKLPARWPVIFVMRRLAWRRTVQSWLVVKASRPKAGDLVQFREVTRCCVQFSGVLKSFRPEGR